MYNDSKEHMHRKIDVAYSIHAREEFCTDGYRLVFLSYTKTFASCVESLHR